MKDKPDLFNLILKTSIECTKKNDEFQKVSVKRITNQNNFIFENFSMRVRHFNFLVEKTPFEFSIPSQFKITIYSTTDI